MEKGIRSEFLSNVRSWVKWARTSGTTVFPTQYLELSRERTKTRWNVGLCGKDEEEIFKASAAHPPLYSTLRMGPEQRFNPETIGIIILVRKFSKRLKDLRHASQLYGSICLFQISYSTLLTIFSQDRILVIFFQHLRYHSRSFFALAACQCLQMDFFVCILPGISCFLGKSTGLQQGIPS